jgi:hypothetical protein
MGRGYVDSGGRVWYELSIGRRVCSYLLVFPRRDACEVIEGWSMSGLTRDMRSHLISTPSSQTAPRKLQKANDLLRLTELAHYLWSTFSWWKVGGNKVGEIVVELPDTLGPSLLFAEGPVARLQISAPNNDVRVWRNRGPDAKSCVVLPSGLPCRQISVEGISCILL